MLRAAKPAEIKIKTVSHFEDFVNRSKSVLLADFTGLSVGQFDKLRHECFKNEIVFNITKNTLAKIVFDKLGHDGMEKLITGPTGYCFGFDDPIVPVRIISAFAREHKKPVIKGVLIEGRIYGSGDVEVLKNIPPREVLVAQVVGTIAAPLSGFVFVLNEILRSFVSVIDGIAQAGESDQSERPGISATGGSVEAIIESIEKMTVLELVELKNKLEEKFGVSAAAPMAMAGPMPGAAEAAEEVEEQIEFTVILTSSGDKKIQVIKEVRALTSLGLKDAKALVDSIPNPIKEGISKDEAMAIKAKIEEAGGQVDVK